MPEQLGDCPLEERYAAQMKAMAEALDDFLNRGTPGPERATGFVLLVFPFGNSEGNCNFISNGANRKDIVCLFKEMIARFEGQPAIAPGRPQ